MSKELWATYSVKDHLDPRTLAADIMMFDRLVFPVPQEAEWRENKFYWKPLSDEWLRWKSNGWDPDAQSRLLELLEPVVRRVTWNSSSPDYERYRVEAKKLAAAQLKDSDFTATRNILLEGVPAYVTGISAVGPAYRSIDDVERELGVDRPGARRIFPRNVLPVVLAAEFLVPDPDDKQLSSEQLLKETVAFVTGDADFLKKRTAFIEWQENFLRNDTTDIESIKKAIKEMRDLLEETKQTTRRLTIRKISRYAFQIAPSAIGLAAAIAHVPEGLAMATTGAFLSIGGIAVDEKLFKPAEKGQPLAVAFVHDARRHFGWEKRQVSPAGLP